MLLAKRKPTILHVDQGIIRSNAKHGTDHPAITIRRDGATEKAHTALIMGPSKMVYRPHDPLDCGARLWIETTATVVAGTLD